LFFLSVTVALPFSSAPPEMPTLAALAVTETSAKAGSEAGKLPPTWTVWGAPLTEMTALVGAAAATARLPDEELLEPLPLLAGVMLAAASSCPCSAAGPTRRSLRRSSLCS
jgi:hypothetical protein